MSGDKVHARTAIARTFTVNLIPNTCPTVRPIALPLKTRFVNVHKVTTATLPDNLTQIAQINYALFVIPFTIPQCFFYG